MTERRRILLEPGPPLFDAFRERRLPGGSFRWLLKTFRLYSLARALARLLR
jgi:hypothetical protein